MKKYRQVKKSVVLFLIFITLPVSSEINDKDELKKNYGQSLAMSAGFDFANGDYIITLDGDGQNNPKDIIKLLKLYNKKKSFLLLIGNRIRRNDSKIRKLVSRAAFYIRKLVFKDNTPDTGCAIKMFRKKFFLHTLCNCTFPRTR